MINRFLLDYPVFMTLLFCLGISNMANAQVKVEHLTCEFQVQPLGMDVSRPRLGWQINSEKAEKQTGYRVLVATDKKI
ncbi:glycoside hydrolase family 78 protein [Niabella ginsengisoli]|uniref:Alpha-L-rhamnosidase n=1 Tax=Niabella ginsengisoli TaxID=522298 RepID=A0ABS9SQE2_9BACT|nr:hypothetical protein [Niabella ginsengisoli]MCH5600572.1 hypothetical protein [Niabella ginsengisoli]